MAISQLILKNKNLCLPIILNPGYYCTTYLACGCFWLAVFLRRWHLLSNGWNSCKGIPGRRPVLLQIWPGRQNQFRQEHLGHSLPRWAMSHEPDNVMKITSDIGRGAIHLVWTQTFGLRIRGSYLDYAVHKVFGPRRFDARTENGQFGVRCAAGVKRVSWNELLKNWKRLEEPRQPSASASVRLKVKSVEIQILSKSR